jgi:CRP-like cAMP-binding protein
MPLTLRKSAKVELLSRVPLFAGLSRKELGQLATIADEIDFAEGKVLIREGERGREFFIVLEGKAEVRRKGKKLAVRREGDFFGEIALVADVPRVATVTATAPLEVLVIRDKEFRVLLQRAPTIAIKVLEAVAARLPTVQF